MEKEKWMLFIRRLSGNQKCECLIEDRYYQIDDFFELASDKHIAKLTFKNAQDEDTIAFSANKYYEILEVSINEELYEIIQESQKAPTAEEIFKIMDELEL